MTSHAAAAIFVGSSEAVEVTMLRCRASASGANALIVDGTLTQATITECDFSKSDIGLEVRSGAIALVDSSKFCENQNFGVLVWQNAHAHTRIGPGNTMSGNQGSGVMLAASGVTIVGCTVSNNRLFGITVEPPPPGRERIAVTIQDCTLAGNGWGGVQFNDRTTGVLERCIVRANKMEGVVVGYGAKTVKIRNNTICDNLMSQPNATAISMLGTGKVAGNNKYANNKFVPESLFSSEMMESIEREMNAGGGLQALNRAVEAEFVGDNPRHANSANQRAQQLLLQQKAPHIHGRLKCAKCGKQGGPRVKMHPCTKCQAVAYCSKQCRNEHHHECTPAVLFPDTNGKEIPSSCRELAATRSGSSPRACGNCQVLPAGDKLHMKCGRCKGVVYCSSACQKQNYAAHKNSCKKQRVPQTKEDYLTVHTTPQHPSLSGTRNMNNVYHAPNGDVTRSSTHAGKLPMDRTSELIIKIQGSDDSLILKDDALQFYSQDRKVAGWITAAANADERSTQSYKTICDKILRQGDAGRMSGKKAYFKARIDGESLLGVDCGKLISSNIEW